MFSHIMIGTKNIEQSKKFYDATLALLKVPEGISNEVNDITRIIYSYKSCLFIITEPINKSPVAIGTGTYIHFNLPNPEIADKFIDTALQYGGKAIDDDDRKIHMPSKSSARYVQDPSGNHLVIHTND